MEGSISDLVKAAWDKVWEPAKWLVIPLTYIAFLGLIFNTVLARVLGFDAPDTLVIGDQVASGLLLLIPTLRQLLVLLLCIVAAALTVAAIVMLCSATYRTGLWLRHRALRAGSRMANRLGRRMKGASLTIGNLRFDGLFDSLRRWLNRLGRRRSDAAGALAKRYPFIKHSKLGLGGVWAIISDNIAVAFERSRNWIVAGSGYAVLASVLVAGLFAAHIALDEAKRYVTTISEYMRYGLGEEAVADRPTARGISPARAATGDGGWSFGSLPGASALTSLGILGSLEGAVNHASQRPRLVSILLKGQSTYLRPMMLIAEFNDEFVLYDFFADSEPGDDRLYPVRSIKPSDVAMVLSAESSTPRAPGLIRRSAVRGMIEASCIEPDAEVAPLPLLAAETPPEAAVRPAAPGRAAPASLSWADEWTDLRRTLIRGDGVNCRSKPPAATPEKPIVIEIGDRLAEKLAVVSGRMAHQPSPDALADIGGSLKAIADGIAGIRPGPDADDRLVASLEKASASLADLVAAVRTRPDLPELGARPSAPPPPPTTTYNSYYYIARVGPGGGKAVYRGKWDDCRGLASWSGSIRFANGRSGLSGPSRNDLELGDGSVDPARGWERLQAILAAWSAEAGASVAENGGKTPFVFLIGRATERGEPTFNLDLTEQRAVAVRTALLATAAGSFATAGIGDDQIIAIGEGETALVPEEIPTRDDARRVDAKLCFG